MNAKQLVKEWQRLFKLQNWKIVVAFHKEYEDEELVGNSGYVKLDVANLSAHIVVNENSVDPVDEIIVHEMLHILLRDLMISLNPLFRTQDARDIFYQVNELLVIRLEQAFTGVKNED